MEKTERKASPARFALLAIVLPVAGALAGAVLEHGAGFVCQIGLGQCAPTESEAATMTAVTNKLAELLEVSQDQLGQCHAVLTDTREALTAAESTATAAMRSISGGQNNFFGQNADEVLLADVNGAEAVGEDLVAELEAVRAALAEAEMTFDPAAVMLDPQLFDTGSLETVFPGLELDAFTVE
ncbi:MAG: hypothetical protein AAGA70_11975 [Pseudomonadota bacterium]